MPAFKNTSNNEVLNFLLLATLQKQGRARASVLEKDVRAYLSQVEPASAIKRQEISKTLLFFLENKWVEQVDEPPSKNTTVDFSYCITSSGQSVLIDEFKESLYTIYLLEHKSWKPFRERAGSRSAFFFPQYSLIDESKLLSPFSADKFNTTIHLYFDTKFLKKTYSNEYSDLFSAIFDSSGALQSDETDLSMLLSLLALNSGKDEIRAASLLGRLQSQLGASVGELETYLTTPNAELSGRTPLNLVHEVGLDALEDLVLDVEYAVFG